MRDNEAAIAGLELVPTVLAGTQARPVGRAFWAEAPLAHAHRADRVCRAPLASRRDRDGARRGAVRNDLFDKPRLAVEPGGDRRGDARPEMDADVPLQGQESHQGIRRARSVRRIQGSHPHRRQSGGCGARPRRAQRHVLSSALGSTPHHRPREPSRLAHPYSRDAISQLRQLRRALLDGRLRPSDDGTARSGHRLA